MEFEVGQLITLAKTELFRILCFAIYQKLKKGMGLHQVREREK